MKIVVVGAGIAGIGAALALSAPGRDIKIIERDPPPPNVAMDEVFDTWERKGVTQLRHSHGFLAKLFNLIRDRYPELLKTLLDAGAIEVTFADILPATARENYRPMPGDTDLSVLLCRRTTLEFILRGYAAKLPGVSFVPNTSMRDLIVEKDADGIPVAKAVLIETADGAQEIRAELIIDASGRNTIFPDCLAKYGIVPETDEAPVGILYYTRHYRLNPGQKAPPTDDMGADIDFIKYGVFPADRNNFSITLQVPEIETTLRQRIVHPEVFDRICAAIPILARWTDPARSTPTSKVFGMGNLKNIWRHWLKDGRPLIKNFFAIGDATIRTNPAYGRGCSFGFVQADLLADVLRATDDPVARAKMFETRTEKAIRPFYDSMVGQDAMGIKRAKHAQDPEHRPKFAARLMKSLAEDAVVPALRSDLLIRRAIFRGAHMLESPNAWMKNPVVLGRILYIWAKPKSAKKDLCGPSPAIDRSGLLELVTST